MDKEKEPVFRILTSRVNLYRCNCIMTLFRLQRNSISSNDNTYHDLCLCLLYFTLQTVYFIFSVVISTLNQNITKCSYGLTYGIYLSPTMCAIYLRPCLLFVVHLIDNMKGMYSRRVNNH